MLKNIIIAGLVILLIVGGIFYFSKPSQLKLAGAVTGPSGLGTFNESIYATGQVQSGGAYTPSSTSTQTTLTLDASSLATNSVIILTPGSAAANMTVTLPSTTTLAALTPAWLPNIGDTATLYVINASTVAASSTTISAGSGETLLSASSTAVIPGTKMASFEFIRNTATTFLVGMQTQN